MSIINCNSGCSTTKVGSIDFSSASGTTGDRDISDIGYGGLVEESFVIMDEVSFAYSPGEITATDGGRYTITDDVSSVTGPDGNPLQGGSGDGAFVFATNDTEPFAYYEIKGLDVGGQYCVKLQMSHPVENTTCNDQMYTTMQFRSLAGIGISGGGLSGGQWERTGGADGCNPTTGGWDGNNQNTGVAKQGAETTYEINFTLGQNPNNTTDDGFRIYFSTNSFQPNNVLGIEGIEVYGCVTQQIESSNGDEICEGTPTTLTALGIGSGTDTYEWREGGPTGDLLPYTSRSFEVIPEGSTTYWVQCIRTGETLTKTISPVNCCGPSGLFTIPKICVPLTANGYLDEDVWNVAPWQDLDASGSFGISSGGDCASGVETDGDGNIAQWRATYDDDNIYFFVRTYDDNPRNAGNNAWYQDGVEIYIDGNGTSLQYGYAWSGDGQPASFYGSGANQGTHVIRQSADYWDLEVAIPIAANSLDFESDFIRMELGINQAKDGQTCRSAQIFSWTPANHYTGVNDFHVSPLSDCASVIATDSTVCNGGSTTLSTQLSTATPGLDYTWEQSTDGGNNWTTVNDETGSTVTLSPTVETMYRATYDGVTSCPVTIEIGDVDIDAGPTTSTYCAGETIELTGVTIESGDNVEWGWKKGTSFIASNYVTGYGLSDDVSKKVFEKTFATGDEGNYYFVVNKGGCEANVEVEVTGATNPTIEAFGARRCGEGTVELTATASAGNITWYDVEADGDAIGTGSPFTSPSLTTDAVYYAEANDNGCISERDSTMLTIKVLPTAVLPDDYTICVANPNTTIEETGADAVAWAWSEVGETGSSIDVTLAGETTYTVTITDAQNCTATESVTVGVDANLSPTVTGDNQICNGASTTLTATGGDSYVWDTGSSDNPYEVSPTATTTYSVTASDIAGCVGTTTYTVTVTDGPTITVDDNAATICVGDDGTLVASGALSYEWNTGATDASLTLSPAVTTAYQVTGTDALGCLGIGAGTITVNPLPTITVGDLGSACADAVPVALSGATPAGGTYSGDGVTGGQFDPNGLAADIYTVTYTYTDPTTTCTNSETGTFEVNPLPSLLLPADFSVCAGEDATITPTVEEAGDFVWEDASAAPDRTLSPAIAGTYAVTFTATSTGCSSSDQVELTINTLPNVQVADGQVCDGNPGTLTASGATTYVWQDNSTGPTFTTTVGQTTVYNVTGTDDNGCANTASGTLTVAASPTVTFDPLADRCESDAVEVLSQGAPIGGEYSGNGVTAGEFDPMAAGDGTHTITYSYTDPGTQCAASATQTVLVSAMPAITLGGNQSICEGEELTLSPTEETGTFIWSTSETSSSIVVAPTVDETYSVTFTNAGGCEADATTGITVISIPQVDFSNSPSACSPIEATFLDNTSPESDDYTYNWDFGDPSSMNNNVSTSITEIKHTYTTPGTYDVTLTVVTGNAKCESSVTIEDAIEVFPDPVAAFSFTPEGPTSFEPTVEFIDESTGDIEYWNWEIDEPSIGLFTRSDQNPVHEFLTVGEMPITLTVTSVNGCVNTTTEYVDVEALHTMYLPNSFTPGGNDYNETFGPVGIGISEKRFEFYIFNRWGELIYETQSFGDFWDGTDQNNGNDVPLGVYTWLMRFEDLEDVPYERTGKVVVVK